MAYKHQYVGAISTNVLGGPGIKLHAINVEFIGAAATQIIVYDNTAASGTVIAHFGNGTTAVTPGNYIFDVVCSTGLTVDMTGVTANTLTVSYE